MADDLQFEDEGTLWARLKGQPRETAIAIAARSALRVLPNLVELFDADWPESDPIPLNWTRLRQTLLDLGKNQEFWIDWYERHRDGRPQNWPLLGRFATIDDAEWKKGRIYCAPAIRHFGPNKSVSSGTLQSALL